MKLIAFDLDGTLAPSKAPLSEGMADLLSALLQKYQVAVISGASFAQFQSQFLSHIKAGPESLGRLFILPTDGAELLAFENGAWISKYNHVFSVEEVEKVSKALKEMSARHSDMFPATTSGEQIENRGGQITFSALGQQALIDDKSKWDPDFAKRRILIGELAETLPDFSIAMGGMTSIDIRKKGIDKPFGLEQVAKLLSIQKEEVLYIGDALMPGGNDYAVFEAGFPTKKVRYPGETALLIRELAGLSRPEHVVDHRPWGEFEEFSKNEPSTVKTLNVKKGEELSKQYHSKRCEFWKVLKGQPEISIDSVVMEAKEGEEFWIERFSSHRIGAPVDDVEILEVSFGEFDEDDIVRESDKYGRV